MVDCSAVIFLVESLYEWNEQFNARPRLEFPVGPVCLKYSRFLLMSENKRLLQGAFPLTSIAHIGMSKNGLLSNMAISILPDLVVFVFFLTVFFENVFGGQTVSIKELLH